MGIKYEVNFFVPKQIQTLDDVGWTTILAFMNERTDSDLVALSNHISYQPRGLQSVIGPVAARFGGVIYGDLCVVGGAPIEKFMERIKHHDALIVELERKLPEHRCGSEGLRSIALDNGVKRYIDVTNPVPFVAKSEFLDVSIGRLRPAILLPMLPAEDWGNNCTKGSIRTEHLGHIKYVAVWLYRKSQCLN